MKYEYTRENMLPIMVELTYEDLQLIQRMAKILLDMEALPQDHGYLYKGDLRKLKQEAADGLDAACRAARAAFIVIDDND